MYKNEYRFISCFLIGLLYILAFHNTVSSICIMYPENFPELYILGGLFAGILIPVSCISLERKYNITSNLDKPPWSIHGLGTLEFLVMLVSIAMLFLSGDVIKWN